MENLKRLLLQAADTGDVKELARALTLLGADVEDRNSFGLTALMISAETGHVDCLSLLTKAGANMNARNSSGWTAPMCAAGNGHVECLALLIKAGADIEAKDSYGRTASMWADGKGPVDYKGHVNCVQMIEVEMERRALTAEVSTASTAKPHSSLRV